MACNADLLDERKMDVKATMKRKETEKRAKDRLEREKRIQEEEELQKKKFKEEKDHMKEENARKQWNSEQEKYLIDILLEKKKLDESTLVNKKVPLDEFQQDERQKRLKQEERMKQQDKLTERTSSLFPEITRVSCKLYILVLKAYNIVLVWLFEKFLSAFSFICFGSWFCFCLRWMLRVPTVIDLLGKAACCPLDKTVFIIVSKEIFPITKLDISPNYSC
jgi:hypothetical protein